MSERKFFLLPILLVFILAACGASEASKVTATEANTPAPIESAEPNRETSDSVSTELGQPFQVRIGESATINGLVITFVAVSEDSRCPRGAECIWAGRVKVMVQVQKDGELLGEFELTDGEMTGGDVGEVQVTGFVVRLLGVTPYPKVGEEIGAGEYVMEMVMEREK